MTANKDSFQSDKAQSTKKKRQVTYPKSIYSISDTQSLLSDTSVIIEHSRFGSDIWFLRKNEIRTVCKVTMKIIHPGELCFEPNELVPYKKDRISEEGIRRLVRLMKACEYNRSRKILKEKADLPKG